MIDCLYNYFGEISLMAMGWIHHRMVPHKDNSNSTSINEIKYIYSYLEIGKTRDQIPTSFPIAEEDPSFKFCSNCIIYILQSPIETIIQLEKCKYNGLVVNNVLN